MEISSNATGLCAALCNPTELARTKGNLVNSYPIEVYSRVYEDLEHAYQTLKVVEKNLIKDKSSNFKLMVMLMKLKLRTYPRLFSTIQSYGGYKWLKSCTHTPYAPNRLTVWDSRSGNWFIDALCCAYATIMLENLIKPKFLLRVNPSKKITDAKAITKANIATKYIGWGEGLKSSSTELYRLQLPKFANLGIYTPEDIVFVSIVGNRGEQALQLANRTRTLKEVKLAIEKGSTLVTDTLSYIRNSKYNTGESILHDYMRIRTKYLYVDVLTNSTLIGMWINKPNL